ncbi:BQ5605_C001g00499 [Microbotryum silenes-dioicae]|uniref:BQ5605_C001g00499 protein n=1 Tax=Microbotryum silenes-dioicae TaxID=796604 RepID=A0A2X0M6W7_9BASI|nr:BQ5605_C001g00499 [Microbotryum silenes-dioicae]
MSIRGRKKRNEIRGSCPQWRRRSRGGWFLSLNEGSTRNFRRVVRGVEQFVEQETGGVSHPSVDDDALKLDPVKLLDTSDRLVQVGIRTSGRAIGSGERSRFVSPCG